VSRYGEIAAALEGLAGWADDKLAAGAPPKWIAQQQLLAVRHVAGLARNGELPGQGLADLMREQPPR
jgi:hypothetical protein